MKKSKANASGSIGLGDSTEAGLSVLDTQFSTQLNNVALYTQDSVTKLIS